MNRILIAGMHRSGTSALAKALLGAGANFGPADQLLGPSVGNDDGHFESQAHLSIADELLQKTGHSVMSPPSLPHCASCDQVTLNELLQKARYLDRTVFEGKSGVVKNPRFAVQLPFWDCVFNQSVPVILPWREPADVADSLFRRNSIPVALGLALWVRHTMAVLQSAPGRALFVVGMSEGNRNLPGLIDFVRHHGIPIEKPMNEHWFDSQRFREGNEAPPEFADDLRPFVDFLSSISGHNENGVPDHDLSEPWWVGAILDVHQISEPQRAARTVLYAQVEELRSQLWVQTQGLLSAQQAFGALATSSDANVSERTIFAEAIGETVRQLRDYQPTMDAVLKEARKACDDATATKIEVLRTSTENDRSMRELGAELLSGVRLLAAAVDQYRSESIDRDSLSKGARFESQAELVSIKETMLSEVRSLRDLVQAATGVTDDERKLHLRTQSELAALRSSRWWRLTLGPQRVVRALSRR